VINGLQHVFEKWVERCKKCIACQGRYFEKETVTAPSQCSNSKVSPRTLQTAVIYVYLFNFCRLHSDPTQVFDVNFEGDWSSDLPHFNFDTDMHPLTVARVIAKETWTKEYFKALEK